MNHEAVLSFAYDDPGRARRIARSLRPEVGEIPGDRSRATVDRTDDRVRITVVASDLVALRAGVNTWTTLVDVAEGAASPGR